MNTYKVKIFKNGEHVDTQTVKAENEGQAKSQAMIQTAVKFMGAAASYEVKRFTSADVR